MPYLEMPPVRGRARGNAKLGDSDAPRNGSGDLQSGGGRSTHEAQNMSELVITYVFELEDSLSATAGLGASAVARKPNTTAVRR